MDYAVAVNEELRALKACGVDVVQLDEPWVRTSPEKATRYGLAAINRALEGIEGPTVVPSLLWLRRCGRRQAVWLQFPAAVGRYDRGPDLDRGGAA